MHPRRVRELGRRRRAAPGLRPRQGVRGARHHRPAARGDAGRLPPVHGRRQTQEYR